MAIVKGPIVMTGGFGNASFYTHRRNEKVITRIKKVVRVKKNLKFRPSLRVSGFSKRNEKAARLLHRCCTLLLLGCTAWQTENCTLILSMAIEFGKIGFTSAHQEVKYAGSGRVLAVN